MGSHLFPCGNICHSAQPKTRFRQTQTAAHLPNLATHTPPSPPLPGSHFFSRPPSRSLVSPHPRLDSSSPSPFSQTSGLFPPIAPSPSLSPLPLPAPSLSPRPLSSRTSRRPQPRIPSDMASRSTRAPPQVPAGTRQNEYFVPRDGIDREVITADICRYLGNDALVRPGNYEVRRCSPAASHRLEHERRPADASIPPAEPPDGPSRPGLLHHGLPQPDHRESAYLPIPRRVRST